MGSLLLIGALLVVAAGTSADDTPYRSFDDARLAQGRAVWLANCEACHGHGVAGAPIPMEPLEWRARLDQDRTLLYRHAIEGFYGPDDTMMPSRGGNDDLTDTEVRAAVDYMAALARSYIQALEITQ